MHTFEEIAEYFSARQNRMLQGLVEQCASIDYVPKLAGTMFQGAPGKEVKVPIPFVSGMDLEGIFRYDRGFLLGKHFEPGAIATIEGSISESKIEFELKYVKGLDGHLKNPNPVGFRGNWGDGQYHGHWSFSNGHNSLDGSGEFRIYLIDDPERFVHLLGNFDQVYH